MIKLSIKLPFVFDSQVQTRVILSYKIDTYDVVKLISRSPLLLLLFEFEVEVEVSSFEPTLSNFAKFYETYLFAMISYFNSGFSQRPF